jgi:CRP-like cAMP-binding protein
MAQMPKKGSLAAENAAVTADVISLLPDVSSRASVAIIAADQIIFRQGDNCEAVYHLHSGNAKVHVLSKSGREAVIMILGPGDFFGESAMLEQAGRICSVSTMSECTVERIETVEVWRRLRNEPSFARSFMDFLVTRNRRYLADLSDHHFYTTEQRLARALLRLPDIGSGDRPAGKPLRISQEMLAVMIGTTRSRVNYFMNKFRRAGMIEYDNKADGHLVVHRTLTAVLRSD